MSDLLRLAEQLSSGDRDPIIRVGIVASVAAGPPLTIVVDGRPMRCLASYPTPTTGDVVVWIDSHSIAIALGPRL